MSIPKVNITGHLLHFSIFYHYCTKKATQKRRFCLICFKPCNIGLLVNKLIQPLNFAQRGKNNTCSVIVVIYSTKPHIVFGIG